MFVFWGEGNRAEKKEGGLTPLLPEKVDHVKQLLEKAYGLMQDLVVIESPSL